MSGKIGPRFLAALAALLLASSLVAAQGPGEYEVKAAFIHNIAKLVDWPAPPAAGSGIKLCIVGEDPFGGSLGVLSGKTIDGEAWTVAHANVRTNLRECRVLFVAASEAGNLPRIIDRIVDAPVLTIGDTPDYAAQGIMVNFYLDGNKVRFEINPAAARRAGLKPSSQLLKLASVVAPGGRAP